MSIKAIMTIIAILLSPVIAVLVSIWVQDRKEKRQQKGIIFSNLMSTRHQNISDEIVRALNIIDVVFHDKDKVRKLWHDYYDILHNTGLNNPTGWKLRDTKKLELIHEMAKAVGYGKEITTLDVDRVYMPVGLVEDAARARAIQDGLLEKVKSQPEKTDEKKE